MGQLDLLMKKAAVATEQQREVIVQTVSSADEIRKYKALLEEGIITQEEFAIKKKELLGNSETIIAKKEYVHQEKPAYEEEPAYEAEEDVERNYSVTLKSTGNRVKEMKTYRELADFGKGIREAKTLIEKTPVVLFEGLSKKQADEHIQAFLRTDLTAMLECAQSDI